MFKSFDPFGIKRRRAEKAAAIAEARQKMLDERQRTLEHRKYLIDGWLNHKDDEAYERAKESYNRDLKEVEKANSTCPICGSKNRIHKFVRTKGQLDGSLGGSSSGYNSLFGGYSHGSVSGKIHGELDTFEVNECRDCGNQWQIAETRHPYISKYKVNTWSLDDGEGEVGYLYRALHRYKEEPEKMKELKEYSIVRQFKGTPRMVIEHLLYSYHLSWQGYGKYDDELEHFILLSTPIHYNEEKENFNGDSYLFQFSEDDWKFIDEVIGGSQK